MQNAFWILILCGLKICLTNGANAETLKLQQWHEDLHFMAQNLEFRHANLYHTISKELLQNRVKELDQRLGGLKAQEVAIEFAKLVALVGDGHTGIFFPYDLQNFPRKYPLELWSGTDGIFIIAAPGSLSRYRGMKIVKIGRSSIEKVKALVAPLLPRDSSFGLEGTFPHYMLVPEVLLGLGIIEDREHAEFTLEDTAKKQYSVRLKPVQSEKFDAAALLGQQVSDQMWLKNLVKPYWFEFIAASKTIYLNYNDASWETEEESFSEFTERLVNVIHQQSAQRLILDLRWNDGGSIDRAQILLRAIIGLDEINQKGRLFTIISPVTFSAAVLFCVDLERNTNTLFVGDPTGGKPNGYGEVRRFRLPHSKLEVRYSAWFHQRSRPNDLRPAILPHLRAGISSGDFLNGHDPAIEVIMNYEPGRDMGSFLRNKIETDGTASALSLHALLKDKNFRSYEFSEESIIQAGYQFF